MRSLENTECGVSFYEGESVALFGLNQIIAEKSQLFENIDFFFMPLTFASQMELGISARSSKESSGGVMIG
ncbi:MAG: hypothetical protein A2289_01240 [Deltaproteobacteria bacterium RIFOXYA12_FULL_58_15]|nr:MAG: hypothetical protein A2289_01240 [Deltaproteobacteria bacterium RIFOXYA12_FULL_58_15]